jgi:transketolase
VRNTFAETLLEYAKIDPRIILITGDLGYGVLDDFQKLLPRQYINAGIAEQSMMSMAAGLASQGYRPFVYSIANFPTFRCLEQIRNDVSYMENPVTIVSVGSGVSYGPHGYTHHAVEDLSIMRIFSNMRIYAPMDPEEVKKSLELILQQSSPAYLRLGKGGELNFTEKNLERNFNTLRYGSSGTICWVGSIGNVAIASGDLLSESNIEVSLVSMFAPTDESITQMLERNLDKPVLTVEEHIVKGGFGSWVLEIASEINFKGRVITTGIDPKNHTVIGSQTYLRNLSGLSKEKLAEKFQEMS